METTSKATPAPRRHGRAAGMTPSPRAVCGLSPRLHARPAAVSGKAVAPGLVILVKLVADQSSLVTTGQGLVSNQSSHA